MLMMPIWKRAMKDKDWIDDNIIEKFRHPIDIQRFLDEIPYSTDDFYRCPYRVLSDRKAHCFDGALFSASFLRRLGFPPLIVDLKAERDDDHVIAVFRQHGLWGAIAKSNFSGLRYREPIFRSIRELVLSYFHDYFNIEYEMTLRAYSLPLNLERFDSLNWENSDLHLERIVQALDKTRHFSIVPQQVVACLNRIDERSYQAGMLGIDMAGVYQVTDRK